MTADQARQELARRELARRELARRETTTQASAVSTPQPSTNRFDTPYSKAMFTGGGSMLGGLSAGALATPGTLGVGTAPAAVAGGIGGAMAGESFRQFLAKVTGGGPQSYQQQIQGIGEAGASGAVGEAIGPMAGLVMRPMAGAVNTAARAVYRNIPDPMLQWVKTRYQQGIDVLNFNVQGVQDSLMGAAQKLGQAVNVVRKQPELVAPPSPATLYPVAEKAANALDAVRRQVGTQYGKAATQALEKPARTSLSKASKLMTMELRQAGLINARNVPIAFGAKEFTSEERVLLNIFEDLKGMSVEPIEGMPEAVAPGTFINYDKARRLLGRIDEAMSMAKTRNTQRIIGSARRLIMDGLKQSDERLGREIPAYGKFVGIRDMLENVFDDPDKTVSILTRSLKDTRIGLREKLQELDALAPPELKFFGDLNAYQDRVTKAELAKKAPTTVSKFLSGLNSPQALEKVAANIFNQPETTMAELEALQELSGMPFLDEFRDMAVRKMFKNYRPSGMGFPMNAVMGLAGLGSGGPLAGMAGMAAGTAMSTPMIQAQMLRTLFPKLLAAQAAGRTAAPLLPPTAAAVSRGLTAPTTQ